MDLCFSHQLTAKYKPYESSHSFIDSFIHSSQRESDTFHVWTEQPEQPLHLRNNVEISH